MICENFHNRWLILNYEKWIDKLGPLQTALVTRVYESSVMKILVDHNFDVITLIKQKSSKIMHVGHDYDSF